ncbi:MAG: hypothetical protein ACI8RT_000457 [Candidatus Azotimanducaceae bacterium]|jgi:hypothetical protein|tara:strand:- start:3507 stop:3953 length:447 start_codon:yes stop_codon:yes gene_type:complete
MIRQTIKIILSAALLVLSHTAAAGHHESGLALQERQPAAVMNVTSVNLGDEATSITAEGKMGKYGKVYVTYKLNYGPSGTEGSSSGQGRGVIDADTVFTGTFNGRWSRKGAILTLRNVVDVDNGDKNLDIITFDTRADTLTVQAYVLK